MKTFDERRAETRLALAEVAHRLWSMTTTVTPPDSLDLLLDRMAAYMAAKLISPSEPIVLVSIATYIEGHRPIDFANALAHLADWWRKECEYKKHSRREDARLAEFIANNVHASKLAENAGRIADALVERRGSTEFPVGQDLINEFANAKKVVSLQTQLRSVGHTCEELGRMNRELGDECDRLRAELDRERARPLDIEKVTSEVVDMFKQVLEKRAHQVTDGPLETVGDVGRVFENSIAGLETLAREIVALRENSEKLEAEIDRLEDLIITEPPEPKTVCCKGCPDCLGLGYSPAVLKDATNKLVALEVVLKDLLRPTLENHRPFLGSISKELVPFYIYEARKVTVGMSVLDGEFVGVCENYPRLSYVARSPLDALVGILALVDDVEAGPKMMPGQEPYTPEERSALSRLVDSAALGDPGEVGEVEGDV